jgi:hypothetical protein
MVVVWNTCPNRLDRRRTATGSASTACSNASSSAGWVKFGWRINSNRFAEVATKIIKSGMDTASVISR